MNSTRLLTFIVALTAALIGLCGIPSALAAPPEVTQKEPNRGGKVDLRTTDPAVAIKYLTPAEGYRVNLFASEKNFPLDNPVSMTWDAKGRLWVCTMPSYPHYQPGKPPNDKLIVLEDTNGDGKADKYTVFAEGLYLPTGFELGNGGVYVAQEPNLVFLKDANGDGKADFKRIILSSFGTEDSHHAISAFTWGPGGGVYFQEGTFLHSQVETPWGPVRLENAGIFRFEPRTFKLSVFVSYPTAPQQTPMPADSSLVRRWSCSRRSCSKTGDVERLTFLAPTQAADYPYLCTFPGHWRRMNGVLHVVPDLDEYLEKHPPATVASVGIARPIVRDWKFDDLVGSLDRLKRGRSFEQGKKLFKEAACVVCHSMKKVGGIAGPDLAKWDKKLKPTDILREILDPSKVITKNYESYVIITDEGKQITGRILSSDKTSITVLANPLGQKDSKPIRIERESIEFQKKSMISLMPQKLLNTFRKEEILDLLAYIIARGDPNSPQFRR